MRRNTMQEILDNRSLIKGFLKPIFTDELRNEHTLMDEDFRKVRDGYACGLCLCEYVTYLPRCPVCGHERDIVKDLIPPKQHELDYLRERASGESAVPRGFDEFARAVANDKDIEQIPDLRKLLPRKKH